MTKPLKTGEMFLAQGNDSILLCEVMRVEKGIAYCEVRNGLWHIGFDAKTGQVVAQGTDHPALPHCLAVRVVMRGKFPGYDYNEQINRALERLDAEVKVKNDE